MIKKSVICCVVLLVLHMLFVQRHPKMWGTTHQWQENADKAQQYIYGEGADTVMVGSSLSARILADSIPMVTSLSFGGCGVEDGLRIILSRKDVPKYVLVESNYIFRNASPKLFSGITDGPMPILRRWFPSLRERYEPISIYNNIFDIIYFRYFWKKDKLKVEDKKADAPQNNGIEILNNEIERRIKVDRILTESELEDRLYSVKKLMTELEEKGSQLVFFEMPINEKLAHLKRDKQTRTVLQNEFPDGKYIYLPSDTSKYVTTDGIHLNFDDSKKYSHYFSKILKEQKLSKN